MPDLHELEAGRARLVVPFRDLEIAIEYHPERVTGRTMAALRRAQTDNDPTAIFGELVSLIAEWDLTRDGEPVPITPDGVHSLGALVTMALILGILGDFADPKSRIATGGGRTSASQKPSPPTSLAAARSATAQSTRGSSSTPNGPESIPGLSEDFPSPALV